MSRPAWKALLLCPILSNSLSWAVDFSHYRGFGFGDDIATVARHAGVKPGDVKLVHDRPAMIQEIDWQVRAALFADPPRPDPVRGGLLSFFEGKLYRMVIPYDRYRIEGMTAEDLIGAISLTYGEAQHPGSEIRFPSNYTGVAKVLARWEDAAYAYDLVRSGDETTFALILYDKQADQRAQRAIVEASRLEALDAPRKAQDEERKRQEQIRLALEKSRAANRPNFRP